jgi:PBS lyase HEAT-like repeat
MLHLLLTALLTLAPTVQTPVATPPDPAAVKSAIAELTDAFAKGKSPERIEAITKNSKVLDAAVIKCIVKGLTDDDTKVQGAAIDALRYMQHPDAFTALQDMLKRDKTEKKIEKDVELFTKLIKGVGQHGNKASIALLADNVFGNTDYKVAEARVLALGHIREKESVEQLIGLMRTAGRDKVQAFMGNFRLALMVLTGVDQGASQDTWMTWWNEHKNDFKVPAAAPQLPKEMQMRWDYYWGNEITRERNKKRGDRGDDPEGK